MNRHRLERLLEGEVSYPRLEFRSSVDSTQDELRRLATAGAAEGTVVLAETQTAGRGRHGRRWHSLPGKGLYISVLWRPERPPAELTRWTVAAGVAACAACRQVSRCAVEIDWPNDLVFEGRKLGGILAEVRSGRSPVEMIVGSGLNVLHEQADFPGELAGRATSLRLASHGEMPEPELLAAIYLRGLAEVARQLKRGAWAALRGQWEALAPTAYDRRVRVISRTREPEFEGRTHGLDETGALRVRRADGETVSVRMVDSIVDLEA